MSPDKPEKPDEHGATGYRQLNNTQLSVFLDNRVGKLAELSDIFDGQELKLVALSVVDSANHAVARLVTTNAMLAHKI